ncbi:MAG TPA: GNAT family N-acetyltransferase [Cyclobacteriaceae bacterium]|nr:GNAT family N-acetyltransferase [Cyclobacteriaceae bacterium]
MPETTITIRNFEWPDLNSVTALTNELGYPTTVEQMKIRMEQILQLENYWTFVAEMDNQVVGYIGINKNYFWEQDGNFIRIQALVVKKEFRRHHVGQQLIEAGEKHARKLNSRLMILNSGNREERQAAHQFYPRIGFEGKSTGYIKRLD